MFFKIAQKDITSVVGEFDFVGSLEDTYFIRSDDKLKEPFIKVENLPNFNLTLTQRASLLENKEEEVKESLTSFKSSALGKSGIYDSDLVQQANLLQILSLNKGGKLRVQLEGEQKQYIFHTKEQVKLVMSDWVKHKDKILGEFEEFKRGGA